MATEDISRNAANPAKRYAGVRLQQGRVTTDDDYNEGARLAEATLRKSLIDVIGPIGSPDAGFSIANPRINAKGELDFDIGAGALYLAGARFECGGEAYSGQTDWLEQPAAERAAPPDGRADLVYVMGWEQPVEAVEDSELFETALGAFDTSTRVRPTRRVRVGVGLGGDGCAAGWAAMLKQLEPVWGHYDPATGLCTPDSKLKVGFETKLKKVDLCSPTVAAGYLGAENQAIRVQIVDAGHFTWGFDNAAPLHRVTIGADGAAVTFETEPKDQAHWLLVGETVEILAWAAILPNGEKLAELTGHLTTVAAAYDPDAHTLTLKDALPPGFGVDWQARADAADLGKPEIYFYLRAWPRGDDVASPAAIDFQPGKATPLGRTGLNVTLEGTLFVPGDYWVIAARPEDPTKVVPWDLLTGRAPTGLRRAFAPLAHIVWSVAGGGAGGSTVSDCRPVFPPLTRRQTCCTFTVGDGQESFGQYSVIQDAIDHLPAAGGCISILNGVFAQDFIVDGRKTVRIEGCGPRTRITGAPGSKAPAVAAIVDSADILLAELDITSGDRIGVQLVDRPEAAALNLPAAIARTPAPPVSARGRRLSRVRLERLAIHCGDLPGVSIAGGREIELEESAVTVVAQTAGIAISKLSGRWPAVFIAADDVCVERCEIAAETGRIVAQAFAKPLAGAALGAGVGLGGVQIAGGSERVALRRNRIAGGLGNGVTLGSIAYVTADVWKLFLESGEFLGLAKDWTYGALGGGLVVDDNGCIQWVPFPPGPKGPGGKPLTPVSAGPLTDIVIEDNEIAGMGQSGVGVAMFFDLAANKQSIEIDGLTIRQNRIVNCLQVELPEIAGALAGWSAYGAVALAVVTDLAIERNLIADNGASHLQPICGVFLVGGQGVAILGNQIRGNGPRVASAGVAAPGLRGGVVLGYLAAPGEAIGTEARPALQVHDNVVVCEDGAALVVVAVSGAASVQRNALTSRGASAVRGEGIGKAAGQAGSGLLSSFFGLGVCVLIADIGASSEFRPIGSFATGKFIDMAAPPGALPRGALNVSNNQVLLDLPDPEFRLLPSSVLLISFDDVAVENNQLAAWSNAPVLLTDLLVLAATFRIVGNRLSETLERCFVSILSFGGLATCSLNQTTHCILNTSLFGVPGRAQFGNLVAIETLALAAGQPAPCPKEYH